MRYELRSCQLPVLLSNYRLAPENPLPSALEDAITSYHWLIQQEIKKQVFLSPEIRQEEV
jgi:acetyl esterase/lipase